MQAHKALALKYGGPMDKCFRRRVHNETMAEYRREEVEWCASLKYAGARP